MTATPRSGSIERFPLATVLSGLSAEGFCGRVELHLNGRDGRVELRKDHLLSAQLGAATGVMALAHALAEPRGDFSAVSTKSSATTSLGSVADVLAQAEQKAKKVAHYAERVGGMHQVWAVRLRALAAILPTLPPSVQPVLRLLDGRRTVEQLLATSPLDDILLLRILARLLSKGVLILPDAALDESGLDQAADIAPASTGPDTADLDRPAPPAATPITAAEPEPEAEPCPPVAPPRPLPEPQEPSAPTLKSGPLSDVGLKAWTTADADQPAAFAAAAEGFDEQLVTDPARPSVITREAIEADALAADSSLQDWLGDEEAFFNAPASEHAIAPAEPAISPVWIATLTVGAVAALVLLGLFFAAQ